MVLSSQLNVVKFRNNLVVELRVVMRLCDFILVNEGIKLLVGPPLRSHLVGHNLLVLKLTHFHQLYSHVQMPVSKLF